MTAIHGRFSRSQTIIQNGKKREGGVFLSSAFQFGCFYPFVLVTMLNLTYWTHVRPVSSYSGRVWHICL